MSIIYIADRELYQSKFNAEDYIQAWYLFESFDEEIGTTQYFIPKCSEKNIPIFNDQLHKLGRSDTLVKTEKGVIVKATSPKKNPEFSLSFLFGLIHIYGKLDIKNGELSSIKAHIPLFGQFLKYEELFEKMKNMLAKQGMFINTSIQKNAEGIVYQISCNDYEILQNIAQYYKSIENINKIPKYDLTLDIKKQLIEFVQTNADIPQDGKAEVVKQLQEGTIKLLTK